MMLPIRRSFGLAIFLVLGILLLPYLSSAQVTPDPNFTPAVLAKNLSAPNGVAFRPTNSDLAVAQTGANQVSLVNTSTGAMKSLASQTAPYEVATRASDGVVAVTMRSAGRTADQVDFYSASGTLLGSITPFGLENSVSCMSGSAFDSNGNFYLAAGTSDGCLSTLYYFAGPTPWTALSRSIIYFEDDVIEGLVFNPVPLPSGSLYGVSSSNGNIDQVFPFCDCEGGESIVAHVPFTAPSSIAIDPLLGDVYITDGSQIFRMPPPPAFSHVTPTVFATGFSSASGISFDNSGNLYVNDTTAGNLWKFTRNAFATAIVPILKGQIMTFTNPNGAMSDQVQTIFIPQSAILNGAASISVVFVPSDPTQLDSRLLTGSTGDTDFFGGGPIPALSTCLLIPSASPNPSLPSNCLVSVQKCYDANGNEQPVCTVQVAPSSADLIELTSSFNNGSLPNPGAAHFAIDFDTPAQNTATDITNQLLDCCSGGGSSKGLCSQTYFFLPGASSSPDFSIGPVSPITVSAGGPSSSATKVPVTSLNSFNSAVSLGVSNVPPGIMAVLNQTSVIPAANATDLTTNLTVTAGSSFESATRTADIATLIANLLASGCIDNGGIANALTSKLSTAQAAINGRQLQTAVNALTAFKSQVQAQTGKHIGTSCSVPFTLNVTGQFTEIVSPFSTIAHSAAVSVTVTALNAASVLVADATSLIHELSLVTTGDPITGFVLNNGVGVSGASVTISNGISTFTAIPADATGFYYFPDTSVLTNGGSYTIQVTLPAGPFNNSSPASQTFTWTGKGQAFNFEVY